MTSNRCSSLLTHTGGLSSTPAIVLLSNMVSYSTVVNMRREFATYCIMVGRHTCKSRIYQCFVCSHRNLAFRTRQSGIRVRVSMQTADLYNVKACELTRLMKESRTLFLSILEIIWRLLVSASIQTTDLLSSINCYPS
jgi:hypothetical protein